MQPSNELLPNSESRLARAPAKGLAPQNEKKKVSQIDPFEIVKQNNEWSAQQAQKQMDFQERMSNTAHQREIEDLKAAGLNPVLSAKLGGASTPNGAMAQADTSGTSAIIDSMLSGMSAASSASGYANQALESGITPTKLFGWGLDFAFGSKRAKLKAAKEIFGEVENLARQRGSLGNVVSSPALGYNPLINSGSTAGSEAAKKEDPWYVRAWKNGQQADMWLQENTLGRSNPINELINSGLILPIPGGLSSSWLKLLAGKAARAAR